jgi:hypothetical protein
MANYSTEVEKRKLAKQDAAQEVCFFEFFKEHPEFDYDAAKSILRKAFEDTGELWTKEKLSDCAGIYVKNGTLSVKAPPTHDEIQDAEMDERKSLTSWILANRSYQRESIAGERARFLNPKATNIQTLRDIKFNVEQKRVLSALPKEQLQEIARGNPPSRWKPVPACYRSKIMLLDLASHNLPEFKQLIQRCGKQQIDAILAQPSEEN